MEHLGISIAEDEMESAIYLYFLGNSNIVNYVGQTADEETRKATHIEDWKNALEKAEQWIKDTWKSVKVAPGNKQQIKAAEQFGKELARKLFTGSLNLNGNEGKYRGKTWPNHLAAYKKLCN